MNLKNKSIIENVENHETEEHFSFSNQTSTIQICESSPNTNYLDLKNLNPVLLITIISKSKLMNNKINRNGMHFQHLFIKIKEIISMIQK